MQSLKLKKNAGMDPLWYTKHEGDLIDVTNERVNAKLGIGRIDLFAPSDAQAQTGIIARVRLISGEIAVSGINIFESKNHDGSIYLTVTSRKTSSEGEEARYMDDIQLSSKAKAQILSYVSTQLEEAE